MTLIMNQFVKFVKQIATAKYIDKLLKNVSNFPYKKVLITCKMNSKTYLLSFD